MFYSEREKPLQSWWSRISENKDIEICKGIEIDKSVYDQKEKRIGTFFLKGIITYCLTMGGVGTFMSAFEIEYSQLTVNIAAFLSAVLCSVLYYRYATENIGYLIYFVLFAASAYLLKDYINSGFYSVVNDVMSVASIYLNLEGYQHYTERISDRYTAITVVVVFMVLLLNILVNNYISRRARYLVATIIVILLNFLPVYFESEPDMFYAILLLGGILMAYLLRSGRHYRLYRVDNKYYHAKDGLSYGLNKKALRQMMIFGFVLVFIFVNVISIIVPKEGYDRNGNNKYKKSTIDTMANLFTLGIEGLFNYYANNGGLSTGRLGGVSSIRLDYKTDITVQLTPYSYETLYLKQFVGSTYVPYQNVWKMNRDYRTPEGQNHNEVEALKKAYEDKADYSAQGKLLITNVDAQAGVYLPYYSDDTNNMVYYEQTKEYTYYPMFYGTDYDLEEVEIGDEFLEIPDANRDVIEDFCQQRNFHGSSEEIISQVKEYFQENIPYTIKPGATPRRSDFVNYFLTKNKKGYCAHFASSTALILRYYGIPTRYCEGYAISYEQMTRDGVLVDDAEYSDYYNGYSAIGETALISVNATDADAHAWVEAYIDGKGWTVVEATPAVSEDDLVDFWSEFSRAISGNDDGNEEVENGGGFNFRINDNFIRKLAVVVMTIFIVGALIFGAIFIYPVIKYRFLYARAGSSDKLIMKYMRYIKKLKRRDKEFRNCINYEEQLDYLIQSGKMTCTEGDREKLLDILRRAGFSANEISVSEKEFAEGIIYK